MKIKQFIKKHAVEVAMVVFTIIFIGLVASISLHVKASIRDSGGIHNIIVDIGKEIKSIKDDITKE